MTVLTKQMLLTYGRGGRPGTKLSAVKGIVIHWTANEGKGANAIANRNYFENHPENKVSAHYIVDDSQVVQCIPDNEIAYHVGAKRYTARAVSLLGAYPNSCTIGIEMCVNKDGNFRKTYVNTVRLAAQLIKKHGLSAEDLWRHYDITGKVCPRYFVDDSTARQFGFASAMAGWKQFKDDVQAIMGGRQMAEEKKIIVPYPVATIKAGEKEFAGYIIDGTTYAPVRGIAEALGKTVVWDQTTKTVLIK